MRNKLAALALLVLITMGLAPCANVSQNKSTGESLSSEGTNESALSETTHIQENDYSGQETSLDSSDANVLVVYFSVTGNTENVAEKIAEVTDADIYEIVPAIVYTDADIDYGNSNSRTSIEQNDPSVRPEIQSESLSLEGYDTIYIGYPIWWGEEPRIMDTFVESYDFGNITMIPFCTSGSSGIGNSGKNLAANAGSGNWIDGQRFDANASQSEVEAWINGLN